MEQDAGIRDQESAGIRNHESGIRDQQGSEVLVLLLFIGVAVAITALAHTAPFPFALDALHAGRVTWRMPHGAGRPTIYLTYDDGPNPAATKRPSTSTPAAPAKASSARILKRVSAR